MIKDLLVQSRFKNNILFEAMAGRTCKEISALSGVHSQMIGKLLNLSTSPFLQDGSYRPYVKALAAFFHMLPKELFPMTLYVLNLPRLVEREYSSEVVLKRLDCREAKALPAPDCFKTVEIEERAAMIKEVLKTLSKSEQHIIMRRFGLDGDGEHTLEEVGNSMIGPKSGKPIAREYIRQQERKALQKLRHPRCSKKLRIFLEE